MYEINAFNEQKNLLTISGMFSNLWFMYGYNSYVLEFPYEDTIKDMENAGHYEKGRQTAAALKGMNIDPPIIWKPEDAENVPGIQLAFYDSNEWWGEGHKKIYEKS